MKPLLIATFFLFGSQTLLAAYLGVVVDCNHRKIGVKYGYTEYRVTCEVSAESDDGTVYYLAAREHVTGPLRPLQLVVEANTFQNVARTVVERLEFLSGAYKLPSDLTSAPASFLIQTKPNCRKLSNWAVEEKFRAQLIGPSGSLVPATQATQSYEHAVDGLAYALCSDFTALLRMIDSRRLYRVDLIEF